VVGTLSSDPDAAWPFKAIFWIRLHGVLNDIRSDGTTFRRNLAAAGVDEKTDKPTLGGVADLALKFYDAIDRLKSALTDDELIYADYRRHTESHPVQTSYDVRWSTRGSQVVVQHRVPALERELTVDELDAAIRRVLEAHQTNEAVIAVDFAKRLVAKAGELLVAARPFFGR